MSLFRIESERQKAEEVKKEEEEKRQCEEKERREYITLFPIAIFHPLYLFSHFSI